MRDLKIKPSMDAPKVKRKNPAPKDADSILKKHIDRQRAEKEPESRDPVRYATDRVGKDMRRSAALAADKSWRMMNHHQEKQWQDSGNVPEGDNESNALFRSPPPTAARSGKIRGFPAALKCRPAGAGAAKSHAGRKGRLPAEPCRKKNSRVAHFTATVQPWRRNDHSAER